MSEKKDLNFRQTVAYLRETEIEIIRLHKILEEAFQTINRVQNEICLLSSGSGTVGEKCRAAWNLNASFLSRHPEFQNRFLENWQNEKRITP